MLIGFNRVNSTKTKESSVDKKQTSITFSKPCESSTNRNSPYFRQKYAESHGFKYIFSLSPSSRNKKCHHFSLEARLGILYQEKFVLQCTETFSVREGSGKVKNCESFQYKIHVQSNVWKPVIVSILLK